MFDVKIKVYICYTVYFKNIAWILTYLQNKILKCYMAIYMNLRSLENG